MLYLFSKKRAKSTTSNSNNYEMMESIINDELVNHLCAHKVITVSQYGFVSGKSYRSNLLLFMDDVTMNFDRGCPVDVFIFKTSRTPLTKLVIFV